MLGARAVAGVQRPAYPRVTLADQGTVGHTKEMGKQRKALAQNFDRVDFKTRSRIMSSVGTIDTGPELVVRRLVHRLGFRYSLHVKSLPGTPDIVFRSKKKVVFVHGCFWHRHGCRYGRSTPKTRADFWAEKFLRNRRRDLKCAKLLRREGWQILVVWSCQTKVQDLQVLQRRLFDFLTT